MPLYSTYISEIETDLLEKYDPEVIDHEPSTLIELMQAYILYTDTLYQYLRIICSTYYDSLNNEIRAILGHLSEYRINNIGTKIELDKAYGHFRRFNLDALKILCDEFDRSFLIILKKQYKYDYRSSCLNYLNEFAMLYFKARNFYINAQQGESVGSDRGKHNVIASYYKAAKEYILLKRYYEKHKKEVLISKWKSIIKTIILSAMTLFGILVSIVDIFF